jgi:hypothetical protein
VAAGALAKADHDKRDRRPPAALEVAPAESQAIRPLTPRPVSSTVEVGSDVD